MDPMSVKMMKLEVIELLVDNSNIMMVLKELLTYTRWSSGNYPEFV